MLQRATVRVADDESELAEIGRGVRQVCLLSPLLFSIYVEAMMIKAMEDIDEGVKVGGKLLRDIRFADDQAVVADSEKGLQEIMDKLVEVGRKYDMEINVKKTKTMRMSKRDGSVVNIVIEGRNVEQVKKFRYLGAMITEDGRCDVEIKTRIGMAKDAFNKRREQLTQRMDRKLKNKTIKAVVWSVALYGSETWTMRKNEIDRLRAFEMWILRRMEKISWKDKVTNEQVLEIVKEKRTIIHVIRSRKKKWIGHVWRKDPHADNIEELRFTRDLFGLVSSPFLLGGLILEAHQWKGKDPKTVAVLRKSLYVDDIITGGNTIQEAQLRKDEVTEILGDATFTLHEWASNAKELEGECDLEEQRIMKSSQAPTGRETTKGQVIGHRVE